MNTESIVLGGGCFWCLEASYQLIKGVESVVSGYSGGISPNPDYYSSHDDDSGYAQVVRVTFDRQKISLEEILDIFWVIHDPTTLNKQDFDKGRVYRSVIFYKNDQQKDIAEASIKRVQIHWDNPIVTEVKPLEKFYKAEEEHQNYFLKHPEQAYCQVIINPKLEKLQRLYGDRMKKSGS